jgi:hypothetical protein
MMTPQDAAELRQLAFTLRQLNAIGDELAKIDCVDLIAGWEEGELTGSISVAYDKVKQALICRLGQLGGLDGAEYHDERGTARIVAVEPDHMGDLVVGGVEDRNGRVMQLEVLGMRCATGAARVGFPGRPPAGTHQDLAALIEARCANVSLTNLLAA